MANLSNINNILRTGSLGVGINRDPLGAFEISSATKPGVKMFNTSTNGKTYEAYSDTNGNYIIYDQDADDNRFVINTSGNAIFAGSVDVTSGASFGSGLQVNRTGHPSLSIITGGNTNAYIGIAPSGGTYVNAITISDTGNATFAGNVSITGRYLSLTDSDYTYILGKRTSPSDGFYLTRLMGYGDNTFYGSFDVLRHDVNDGELRMRQLVAGTVTDVMTIVDGNVLIGDTTGTSPNSADRFLKIGKSNLQDCSIILQDAVETWEIYQNDDLQFSFGTTPSTVMTMQRTTGNVGIGTTSPSQKLEVTGNFKLNGTVVQEGTGNNLTFKYRTANSNAYTGGNATCKFGRFYWTPAHWVTGAPVIKVTLHCKYYQGERREYIIKAGYQDTDPVINELQPSSTQQKITLLVGATTSAGYNYAGQPVYYVDLQWVQTAYIWGWAEVESQVGFLTSNPTSTWGGVVMDSAITQNNLAGLVTNYNSFFAGNVAIGRTDARVKLEIAGAGQATANIADSGSSDAFIQASDTGNGFGRGGGILFSATNDLGTRVPQAAIKSLLTNGVSRGIGDLAFSTRNSATDTALTERMRITSGGIIQVKNGSTVGGEIKLTGTDNDFTLNGQRGQVVFQIAGTDAYIMDSNQLYPAVDNGRNLGTASLRYSVVYSANGVSTSDETLKENIKECDLGIDFIDSLKPKSYNLKDLKEDNDAYGKKRYGLIAQDILQTELKDSVFGKKDGEYGLSYNDLIAPIIKAIQELKADNDSLKARIETLENK